MTRLISATNFRHLFAFTLAAAAALPGDASASITMALGEPTGAQTRFDAFSAAGYGFYTPLNIGTKINRLGYWDQSGDGLAMPHDVMVVRYNGGSSYVDLIKATVPAGTAAPLEGGYRWVSIPETILPDIGQSADFYGIVASHGTDLWTEQLATAVPMKGVFGTVLNSSVGNQTGPINPAAITMLGNRPGGWGGANMGYESLPADPDKRLKIMPLGDSITVGFTDNAAWNVPFEFGYRGHLANLLTNAGLPFRFVGGSAEPFNNTSGDPTRGGTVYPVNELRDPGIAQSPHRGIGGIDIPGVTNNVTSWIVADDPDVILLMIGTNGISSNSPAQLDALVSTVYAAKPTVGIVVAQIIPAFNFNPDVVSYNAYIRETLVPAYRALGRKISTVDQYKNFLTNPAVASSIDTAKFSNGINHPTNPAYDLMADTWLPAILSVALDGTGIPAGTSAGEVVATLSHPSASAGETSTFSLVAGEGDTDNGKFTIQGNQLRAGSHPFGLDAAGKTYSIRVQVTGSVSGVTSQPLVLNRTAMEPISGTPALIETFSDPSEVAYAGDVKADDLLTGLAGTHLNYRFLASLPGPHLNDGVHGGATDTAAIAWASDGNITSSTYELGAGSGAGYDISRVTTIAAWTNAGFMNQKYKVSIRYAGASRFTPEPDCTVDFQPVASLTAAGATKVVITRPCGMLFRGIDAIRFTVLDSVSDNAGGVTFREIDVEGAAAVVPEATIVSIDASAIADGRATFTWKSKVGKTYKVESSATLGSWVVLDSAYPSEGLATDFTDATLDETDVKQFYRITENAP